jgi:hypothetical protein
VLFKIPVLVRKVPVRRTPPMKNMYTCIFVGVVALLCLQPGYADCEITPDASGHVNIPNSTTSIKGEAFKGCSELKSITIPNSVTSILPGAFEGCSELKSVTIPNSVTSIGQSAFHTSGLTSLTIPNNLSRIEDGFCNGCLSLETLSLGDKLTHIDQDAFVNCKSLKSVTIPYGVTHIGAKAFVLCTNLGSVKIPATVTEIGKDAFGQEVSTIQCDKQCETGPPACNPMCSRWGCTVESLKKVSCPGTGNCPDREQCEAEDSANAVSLSLTVTSVLLLALLVNLL